MISRTARTTALAATAYAVIAALGLASAGASHIVKIASHISIRGENLTFHGRVTSPNSGCLAGRKVVLHRTNGDILGHAHTNRHGHWKITAQGSAGITMGRFYAVVTKQSQGAAGTIYVCKRARSKTIPYQQ